MVESRLVSAFHHAECDTGGWPATGCDAGYYAAEYTVCACARPKPESVHVKWCAKNAYAGTNTYLITPPTDWNFATRNTPLPAILVDTGDDREDYAPFLEAVLRGNLNKGDASEAQPVVIVITDMYVCSLMQYYDPLAS